MSVDLRGPTYAELLIRVPPRVIRSEEENEHFIEELRRLEEQESEWG